MVADQVFVPTFVAHLLFPADRFAELGFHEVGYQQADQLGYYPRDDVFGWIRWRHCGPSKAHRSGCLGLRLCRKLSTERLIKTKRVGRSRFR